MDTLEQAIEYLRFNNTPFWWVKSGNSKIADNTDESDINASVNLFRQSAAFWPNGNYKLEMSRNPKDRSGSYQYQFTKGATANQPGNTMQPVNSTNAYGIADHVLKQIQEEAKRTLLFEQMADKFGPMVELVKDLDTRLTKVEKFLKDEDHDGTPDFLESIKKVGDVAKAGKEFKNLFG